MKTYKEFRLDEKVKSKAEIELDKVMKSPVGNRLNVAVNDGDENAAQKILSRSIKDAGLIDDILELLFGAL